MLVPWINMRMKPDRFLLVYNSNTRCDIQCLPLKYQCGPILPMNPRFFQDNIPTFSLLHSQFFLQMCHSLVASSLKNIGETGSTQEWTTTNLKVALSKRYREHQIHSLITTMTSNMCIYMYIYIHIHNIIICVNIYIYMYIYHMKWPCLRHPHFLANWFDTNR